MTSLSRATDSFALLGVGLWTARWCSGSRDGLRPRSPASHAPPTFFGPRRPGLWTTQRRSGWRSSPHEGARTWRRPGGRTCSRAWPPAPSDQPFTGHRELWSHKGSSSGESWQLLQGLASGPRSPASHGPPTFSARGGRGCGQPARCWIRRLARWFGERRWRLRRSAVGFGLRPPVTSLSCATDIFRAAATGAVDNPWAVHRGPDHHPVLSVPAVTLDSGGRRRHHGVVVRPPSMIRSWPVM